MASNLNEALARAKELLRTARNAAMATVNEDGTPHNTPFFFIHDETLEYVYWASHPESQHSRNMLRTDELFIVLYEANQGGGLYIAAAEVTELAGVELQQALQIHNAMREKESKQPLPQSYYEADSSQRIYRARPTTFYVNYNQRGDDGNIIRDIRAEVSRLDLVL